MSKRKMEKNNLFSITILLNTKVKANSIAEVKRGKSGASRDPLIIEVSTRVGVR